MPELAQAALYPVGSPLPIRISLSNHILAPLVTHPNLMHPAGLNVYSAPHAERLSSRFPVPGIGNRKSTAAY